MSFILVTSGCFFLFEMVEKGHEYTSAKGFARGTVDFKVKNNGYSADVVVAIKNNNAALLYDLVNIKSKNIADEPVSSPEKSEHPAQNSPTNNSIPDYDENVNKNSLKFSLKETAQAAMTREEVIQENEKLRKANNLLKGEFSLTNGGRISMESAEKIAKDVLSEFSSSYDVNELTEQIFNMFEWYDAFDSEEGMLENFNSYDYLMDVFTKIGFEAVKSSSALDISLYDKYKDARNKIKNMRFALPENVLWQINKNHDGKFIQHSFGKFKYVSKFKNPDAPYLSSIYSELVSAYPDFFSEKDSEYEQPQKLLDFWKEIAPTYYDPMRNIGLNEGDAAVAFAYEIFNKYLDEPTYLTFADKKKRALDAERRKLKIQYSRDLEEAKKQYRIEYNEKRIVNQTRARLRGSIVRNVNQLFKRLENPTEARHIPDRLKEFTKEFIDPKYFFKNLPDKKSYEELKKYSGVAVIKEIGGFDAGTGISGTDWLVRDELKDYGDIKAKWKAFKSDGSYWDDITGYGAAKADEKTWTHIWNAVKNEVRDKQGLTGEALLNAAGKRFNEVIEKTQVRFYSEASGLTTASGSMGCLSKTKMEKRL